MTPSDPRSSDPRELLCDLCDVARDGDALILTFGERLPGAATMDPALRVVLSVDVATQLRDTLARAMGGRLSMPRLE
jgi:hypothetical protein